MTLFTYIIDLFPVSSELSKVFGEKSVESKEKCEHVLVLVHAKQFYY